MAIHLPLTYGDISDTARPLAIAVHGFPDTPHTWRHLGPVLADHGYRVAAPWLPGYEAPTGGPISVGTYVRHIRMVRRALKADERAVLIGHDWGAYTGYGVVASDPRCVQSLDHPGRAARAGVGWLDVQLPRRSSGRSTSGSSSRSDSLKPLCWSPDSGSRSGRIGRRDTMLEQDISWLREYVTAETIAGVIGPYRAMFNPEFADPDAEAETAATLTAPPIPTLYLHGTNDGGLGCGDRRQCRRSLAGTGVVVPDDRRRRAFPASGTARLDSRTDLLVAGR